MNIWKKIVNWGKGKHMSNTNINKMNSTSESDPLEDAYSKKLAELMKSTMSSAITSNTIVSPTTTTYTGTGTSTTYPTFNGYTTGIYAAAGIHTPKYSIGSTSSSVTISSTSVLPSIFSLYDSSSKELMRVNRDGSVTWHDDIKIDEAAEAFGKAINLGSEISSGITENVKRKMRDSVFEDLISIAKEKGSLNAEDLTYLLQASKIVEKLKGGK